MKLAGLLESKRTWITVAAVLLKLLGDSYGLDQQLSTDIVTVLMAWVVGDSVRPDENPFTSRRVWVVVATVLAAIAARLGLELDQSVIQPIVLSIAAWLVGSSLREPLSGVAKQLQIRTLRDARNRSS